MEVDATIRTQLAPTGVLRAGINLSNFLLVTGETENGDPEGVSPDLAAEIARRLGVEVAFTTYADAGLVTQAVNEWDIGNIGAEPQRAKHIAFTAAYCEIEATFLVPANSTIQSPSEVDRTGNRIAVKGIAAYGLWLERNFKNAELVRTNDNDASFDEFVEKGLDALAGLRPRLLDDVARLPGAQVLDGKFSAVQQAVGTPRKNVEGAVWLAGVVEDLKATGFVANTIARHGVKGLSVAPLVDGDQQ
jgi:polar amino acid transport system substrate-binding protein